MEEKAAMNYEIKEKSDLEKVITVRVEPEDYHEAYRSKLKKERKSVNMKGFRPGKAPMRIMEKMYGHRALVDVLNEQFSEGLKQAMEELSDLSVVGEPKMADGQENFIPEPGKKKDYSIDFDLGLRPKFDLPLEGENGPVRHYDVQVPDDVVEKQWENILSRMSESEEKDGPVEEGDVLTLEGTELKDGEEQPDSFITSFSIASDLMTDEAKEKVLGKGPGDTFDHNIYELEKDADEEFVKEQLLQLDEDDDREVGKDFRYEILEIKGLKEPEMDEEFFEKVFPDEGITSKEEGFEKLRKDLKKGYQNEADKLLLFDAKEHFMEHDTTELPEAYIRKFFLKEQEDEINEDLVSSLKWMLMFQQLVDEFDLDVKPEELRENIIQEFENYLGGQPMNEDMKNQVVQSVLQNEEMTNKKADQILSDKVTAELKERIPLKEQEVSPDELTEVIQEFNKMIKGEEEEE